MKLLTHNMLSSKCIKGVSQGYPLGILAKDVKVKDVEFNNDFISRVIPKLHWKTLCEAAETVGHAENMPKTLIDNFENDEDFLKKVHHVLLEVEVMEGELICPETGRRFPITSGVPNMLLNEDEV